MTLVSGIWCANVMHFGSEPPARRSPSSELGDVNSADLHNLQVMIVEDELFVAMHLESVLAEVGCQVSGILSTGESAVEQFPMLQPDIILMDINLGKGIDGIIAAQQIRAVAHVQVIFVSAYGDAATRSRVETALPGSPLLSKPVTPSSLKNAIQATRRH